MRVNAGLLSEALDQGSGCNFRTVPVADRRIEAISRASGALGANIMEPSGRGTFGAALSTENLDPLLEGYVREDWGSRDFRANLLQPIHRDGVVFEADFVSKEQFDHHEYYQFMRKYGVGDCVLMDISAGKNALYFVLQNRLADDSPQAGDMPHFHAIRTRLLSAVQLAQHIDASRVMGMAAAFQTSNIGCIFFDRKGLVTITNPKAEALFSDDFRISRGEVAHRLRDRDGAFPAGTEDRAAGARTGCRDFCLPFVCRAPANGRSSSAFERFGTQLADVFSHSCAMALIEDPDDEMRQNPETLMALFDLTPAETRISLLVASGMSAVDIASQHGIGYETVRSHIRSIFQKTGTGRQSELSALFGKIRL